MTATPTAKPRILITREPRLFRADRFRVLILDLATSYAFPTAQEAADFTAKHLPEEPAQWSTAR